MSNFLELLLKTKVDVNRLKNNEEYPGLFVSAGRRIQRGLNQKLEDGIVNGFNSAMNLKLGKSKEKKVPTAEEIAVKARRKELQKAAGRKLLNGLVNLVVGGNNKNKELGFPNIRVIDVDVKNGRGGETRRQNG